MQRFPGGGVHVWITLLLFLTAPAPAQENMMMTPPRDAAAPRFVDLGKLDLKKLLPPPPAPDSIAARADLDTVLQVQAWRTPAQEEWTRRMDPNDAFIVFGKDNLLGPEFLPENFPTLLRLLRDLATDLQAVGHAAKEKHPRARPYEIDASVQPSIKPPDGGSYPSGNALSVYARAAVLAELFPAKRAAIFRQAQRVAWSRVIAGVHFPTDLEGARRLAEGVMAEVFRHPDFRFALAACRAEAALVIGETVPR